MIAKLFSNRGRPVASSEMKIQLDCFYVAGGGLLPKSNDLGRSFAAKAENEYINPFLIGDCGKKRKCEGTVTYNGKCYWAAELNYMLWGMANRLCYDFVTDVGSSNRCSLVDGTPINSDYSLATALALVGAWRSFKYGPRMTEFIEDPWLRGAGLGISGRTAWTRAGWYSDDGLAIDSNISDRCAPCNAKYRQDLYGV